MRSDSIIDNEVRLDRADAKIVAQTKVISNETGGGLERERRLMIQMRGNKAQLEFNRLLLNFADPVPETTRPHARID